MLIYHASQLGRVMRYHFIRIFALKRQLPPILVATGDIQSGVSRSDYLRSVFSDRINFFHRKRLFVYMHLGYTEDGNFAVGRIGRQWTDLINAPPEKNFEEEKIDSWRAANVLIDVTDHRDGQKVAMQHHNDVGKPFGLIESLINHVNEQNRDSEWVLEVATISDERSFWDVVEEHEHSITAAQFSFITPNILGLRSELNKGLQDARDKNGAREVEVVLKNDEGGLALKEQENIKDAIEYTAKGGGRARLKVQKKVVYDSNKKNKTATIPEDEPLTPQKKSVWGQFVSALFDKQ